MCRQRAIRRVKGRLIVFRLRIYRLLRQLFAAPGGFACSDVAVVLRRRRLRRHPLADKSEKAFGDVILSVTYIQA